MKITSILNVIISLLFVITLRAQNFDYLPAQKDNHQIIKYSEFAISYNEEHEQPDWVAYELTREEVTKQRKRCDCFESDPKVNSGSATEDDYRSTGFDKGHLSPAADNKISETANRESFLMSNMSPQLPDFNRNKWSGLEEWVRGEAKKYGKIYVVTGPVFINNLGKMGKNEVTIPGYYYKVILRFDGDKPKTIAFLMPQVGATNKYQDYAVTVNTIETLTGVDFFPQLDNSLENRVEAQFELKNWDFKVRSDLAEE